MPRQSLTDHQRWTIIHALYTAAEQYTAEAARIDNLLVDPSITEQFNTKASEARELARIVEHARVIEISLSG
jgi:hypothetical protein